MIKKKTMLAHLMTPKTFSSVLRLLRRLVLANGFC